MHVQSPAVSKLASARPLASLYPTNFKTTSYSSRDSIIPQSYFRAGHCSSHN